MKRTVRLKLGATVVAFMGLATYFVPRTVAAYEMCIVELQAPWPKLDKCTALDVWRGVIGSIWVAEDDTGTLMLGTACSNDNSGTPSCGHGDPSVNKMTGKGFTSWGEQVCGVTSHGSTVSSPCIGAEEAAGFLFTDGYFKN